MTTTPTDAGPAGRLITLRVTGMACRRCVRQVTARMRDVPGVETVEADPVSGTVRLRGSMTTTDVLASFASGTYTAEVMTDAGVVERPLDGVSGA